ncbi:periodic tryptophan protein 2 [Kipferlia bialata]|uniref:Periodic tryptophan protein 2 n=1 Tax=Kipferlia bialata TaxID=797122 RepID=A0A9K3CQD5_9EUKA|nr:periodic tryptophan protein 2 [Kipferlia bialata]|eukprot:g361.t1
MSHGMSKSGKQRSPRAEWFIALAFTLNFIIGVGILALPAVFAKAGIIMTAGFIICMYVHANMGMGEEELDISDDSDGEAARLRKKVTRQDKLSRRGKAPTEPTANRKEILCNGLVFAPDGGCVYAATPEGVSVFSLAGADAGGFDATDLEPSITVQRVVELSGEGRHSMALAMSLRLGSVPMWVQCLERVPLCDLESVMTGVHERYIGQTLTLLADYVQTTSSVQFALSAAKCLVEDNREYINNNLRDLSAPLLHLQRAIKGRTTTLDAVSRRAQELSTAVACVAVTAKKDRSKEIEIIRERQREAEVLEIQAKVKQQEAEEEERFRTERKRTYR